MYLIAPKHQRLIIGMLSLLFYTVTPSVANENVLQLLEKEFQKVVTDARPAVVKVVATSTPFPPNAEKLVFTRQEISSGIVINTTGHVVTTTFEMETPSKIEIVFTNGAVSAAELVGTDIFTDIAVLQVAEAPLTTSQPPKPETVASAPPPALSRSKARMSREFKITAPVKWGDSSEISTGSWVVTIGSSYGNSPIVSFGIVGGWDTLPNQLCRELIKINAAVTPGNSGGAVINTSGEIVGMILAVLTEPPDTTNSLVDTFFQKEINPDIAKFLVQELSQKSRTQEIAFAMPMEMVRTVAEEIIEHGKVARGWLGVEVEVVDLGVFITGVIEGSPAYKSGLLPRDLILEFNEVPVHSHDELLRCVVSERPATKVQLKIGRNGTKQHRTVILGERQ
ncbi:PDZ domain-containing protein [Candidatus Poribacteria bacterium]|nr:PDZ domain-containing protein [Candidatus Poribacteria bacterium]MYB02339.1 PDZ domain-containing protein [Candidatus Poribacteria bacterium]